MILNQSSNMHKNVHDSWHKADLNVENTMTYTKRTEPLYIRIKYTAVSIRHISSFFYVLNSQTSTRTLVTAFAWLGRYFN